VTVKGTLAGCESVESEATEGKFVAHFKSAEPISCETLHSEAGVGAGAEENKLVLKLKPKHGAPPMGTFSLPIHEGPTNALSGTITSEGPFFEDLVGGSVSETFTGGPHCGEVVEGMHGNKAKQVKRGTFVGTLSVS
jgi:hypothetical protein